MSKKEINKFASNFSLQYFETSAKSSKNINSSFETFIEDCIVKVQF